MARHLAPFSWRQRMAEMVRRRSFGCVLPLGRHASTNGSKFVHCASDTIALSSFQKEQNARHHKQFKREQALDFGHPPKEPACCAPARTTLRVEYDHGEPAEICVSAAVAHCEEELLLHIAGERQIRGELPPGRITGVKR